MVRSIAAPLVLTLAVDGSATMMESPAVVALATEQFSHGVCALRIDLRDCVLIDSTFWGTLLTLKRRLDAIGGKLTLVSPSADVLELLQQMGLEDFYAIDVADRVVGPWQEVSVQRPDREQLKRLVLEAHEALGEVPGPAASEFRDVAAELRRNIEPDSSGAHA